MEDCQGRRGRDSLRSRLQPQEGKVRLEPLTVLELPRAMENFPATTYRRPWHYNSSTCVFPPFKMGWALKNINFNAYYPLYFFANLSTDH